MIHQGAFSAQTLPQSHLIALWSFFKFKIFELSLPLTKKWEVFWARMRAYLIFNQSWNCVMVRLMIPQSDPFTSQWKSITVPYFHHHIAVPYTILGEKYVAYDLLSYLTQTTTSSTTPREASNCILVELELAF